MTGARRRRSWPIRSRRMRDEFEFPSCCNTRAIQQAPADRRRILQWLTIFDVRFAHCVTGMTRRSDGRRIAYTSPERRGQADPSSMWIACDWRARRAPGLAAIEFQDSPIRKTHQNLRTPVSISAPSIRPGVPHYFSDRRMCTCLRCAARARAGLLARSSPGRRDEADEVSLVARDGSRALQKFVSQRRGALPVESVNLYNP